MKEVIEEYKLNENIDVTVVVAEEPATEEGWYSMDINPETRKVTIHMLDLTKVAEAKDAVMFHWNNIISLRAKGYLD